MPFDIEAVAERLALARDDRAGNAQRGRALEDVAQLLFSSLPGVSVEATNSLDVFACQEIDVACGNVGHPEGLLGFDRIILVECKNWSSPVGAMEVAWLDTKLRVRGRRTGVLLAMHGITGNAHALTSANQILALALAEGREILVVAGDELDALRSPADLVQLLRRKSIELNLTRGLRRPPPRRGRRTPRTQF